MYNNLPAN